MRGKFTKYPAEFWKNLQINAGIIVTGFVNSTGAYTGIVGATSGGTTFNPNPTFEDFGEDIDNVPPNTKQLKRIISYDPSLSGTFKTVSADTAEMLCPGSESSGLITPADVLEDSMFVDVTLVADYSEVNKDGESPSTVKAGYIAVTIKNALNISGFQWKTNKDGKGEFAFDFHGHYDLDDPDDPPFEIYVSEPTRPTLASLTVTSEAGSSSGKSTITVSGYSLGSGESYVYKTAADTAPSVAYGDNVSTWTTLTSGSDITPAIGHTKITVAVKNGSSRAVGSGSATLTVAA